MSATFGNNIRLTILGESHGEGIGVVLDGLPPGLMIDEDLIGREMERRAPGRDAHSTTRKEPDSVLIKSGLYKGFVTGAPLLAWIPNTDRRSGDYDALDGKARPGHADFTAFVKYHGFSDPRGGGHFSGRLTAALTFAGAVSKQYLKMKGVHIGAKVDRIYTETDLDWSADDIREEIFSNLSALKLPTLDKSAAERMAAVIADAKSFGDSVGGIVSAVSAGVPAGLGAPFFDSFESFLSHLLFSIPAVKGVEFGNGFEFAGIRGSEANDPLLITGGKIYTGTNHSGGINGGITNGMPVLVRAAIRPTPSIAKKQSTVDLKRGEPCTIEIGGRHDPCIVPRVVPVIEAALAVTLFDFMMEAGKWKNF